MTKIVAREILEQKIWEDFLTKHPEASFLQSWQWGEFHRAMNDQIWRFGFYENEKLVGVMLIAEEKSRRGNYLVVPGGPIIDWQNSDLVKEVFATMRLAAKKARAVMIRVRPQLEDTEQNRALFAKNHLRPAPMHLHAELTHRLDLSKSPEELLAGMRQGTRYDIKRAGKLGIEVEVVAGDKKLDYRNKSGNDERNDSAEESLKKFYKLQIETAGRQNFVPFSEKFLTEQFRVFAETGNVLLYDATKDGETLAMAFVIFYNSEAVYHYGVSSDAGRKLPGAAAAQWAAILEAKKRGIETYNFWGVSPENETNHRFAGLSRFKRGFGGADFAYLHAHDLVVNRFGYARLWLVETMRRLRRRV